MLVLSLSLSLSLSPSHPTPPPSQQIPVNTPAEAEEMFDVISYRKGACIIRMLYDWIGREVCITILVVIA